MKRKARKRQLNRLLSVRPIQALLLLSALLLTAGLLFIIDHSRTSDTKTITDLAKIANAVLEKDVPPSLQNLRLDLNNSTSSYAYIPGDYSPLSRTFELCATFTSPGLDITEPRNSYMDSSNEVVTVEDFKYHRKGRQCYSFAENIIKGGMGIHPILTAQEQQVFDRKQDAKNKAESKKYDEENRKRLEKEPRIQTKDLDYNLLVSTFTKIATTHASMLSISYDSQELTQGCYETDGVNGLSSAPNGKAYSCSIELKKEYIPVSASFEEFLQTVNKLTATFRQLGLTKGNALGIDNFIYTNGGNGNGHINFAATGTVNGFNCAYNDNYYSSTDDYKYLDYLVVCRTVIDTSIVPPGFN